ncbi:MAG TPA: AAA family ATPase, partial [Polyangiaceae bacterium]|nr:AAA family ATPase [Polyangiaceae bacterium]
MHDDQLNFAVPGTSFVGREAAIERMRAGGGLVTLVGPPGVGKTRLAMEYVARAVRDGAASRGRLVDLVLARSPRDLCHAVARALGIVLAEPIEERVRTVLAQSKSLIVALDNFEQLVDECAPLIAEWRGAAGDFSIIVTSRRPLGLRDERVIELAPLALPSVGSLELDADAAALFVERARAVRPGYAPLADEAPQIVELVVRLDGLPLAIELAAARMAVMGPAQLLGRIGRVASLVDAVECSWDLLSAPEQSALAQLSVFHGGFAAEAAEAVLDVPGDALDHLASLRRHSLLTASDVLELPGELRFGMLEPIRDFAAARLEKENDVRDRHAAYFLRAGASWAETVEKSPRELARLAIELPNVLEVHRHALTTGRPAWAIQ